MSFDTLILNKLFDLCEHRPYVSKSKMAAAIVFKKEIISIGFNRLKTHPLQKEYAKNEDAIFLHAEIDAIIQAKREITLDELSRSTLYITRRKQKDGLPVWGMAKPCKGCSKCIEDFNIQNVIYTTEGERNK